MSNPILETLTMTITKNKGTPSETKEERTYDIPQGTVTEADLEDLKENGTVANARQLIPSAMETERVPYNFRTSGGSLDIGDREFDKLVGLSLPWNQLVKNGNFASTSEWAKVKCTTSASNNVLTITRSDSGAMQCFQYIPTVVGHKYLVGAFIKSDEAVQIVLRFGRYYTIKTPTANTWVFYANIHDSDRASSEYNFYADTGVLSVGSSIYAKDAICIDLTQLFGSTIADYIYSLETATAGAGVAWFKKFFPKAYYAYNSGEIESVKVSSHDMVGFNQWDEEVESGYIMPATGEEQADSSKIRMKNYMPILPNTTYYKKTPTAFWNVYFDANKNYIGHGNQSQGVFTTPSNACYMRCGFEASYGTTYNHDICIHLAWDGARDGEYEPYVKHSYELDPIELRGFLLLDSNNEPYAYGDEYWADGTVDRIVEEYDMGNLNYARTASYSRGVFYCDLPLAKKGVQNIIPNLRAVGYETIPSTNSSGLADSGDKKITFTYSSYQLIITNDAYSTVEAFKTAMSGVKLIVELATPTTESADPFTDPQTVDNWGTEQYVDKAYTDGDRDVEIPVGHETKYPVNLRDKLETSPNAPTSDGDYIVHCESGQLTYIALGSTTIIQNIISRLEALEG